MNIYGYAFIDKYAEQMFAIAAIELVSDCRMKWRSARGWMTSLYIMKKL